MILRSTHRVHWAGLLGLAVALAGCRSSTEDRAAEAAKEALGVETTREHTTGREKRDVVVIEDRKVVDAQTGKTLQETKQVTPVTVETKHKENVDINVGPTQTPGAGTRK
ncbi:MAG: hypothetical protein IRY99_16050 [Isosphaeraceae bacterium]|nr:hypothetical protein [Isosphaeraceae bacterium]